MRSVLSGRAEMAGPSATVREFEHHLFITFLEMYYDFGKETRSEQSFWLFSADLPQIAISQKVCDAQNQG